MAIIRKETLCINRNAMRRINSIEETRRNKTRIKPNSISTKRRYKTQSRHKTHSIEIVTRNSYLYNELIKENGKSSDEKENRVLVYVR